MTTNIPSAPHDAEPREQAAIHHPHGHPPPPDQPLGHAVDQGGKGKDTAKPVPIRPAAVLHDQFDIAASPSGSTSSYQGTSPTSPGFSPTAPEFLYAPIDDTDLTTIDPALVRELYDNDDMRFTLSSTSKGKEKDAPPTLPPLSFSEMSLNYDQASWPSFGSISSPGPSSYASTSSPMRDMTPSTSPRETAAARSSPSATSVDGGYTGPSMRHMPPRCRSLTNLTTPSSPSFASLTMSKIKVKLGPSTTTQSNLARKLLFGKRGDTTPDSGTSSETASLTAVTNGPETTTSSSLDPSVVPWYAATLQYDVNAVVPPSFVRPRADTEKNLNPRPSRLTLRAKGRSKSSPHPFSALDFVPTTSNDIFKPLPLPRRNYFYEILPKEIQIHILKCFVQSFEEDHAKAIADGRWTISKAISSRHQLVGRDRGIRELLKLARVSRSWQNLIFDGQLWTDLDLHSFPGLPKSTLLRLTHMCGPFVRRINFAGHCHLQAATLTDIANHLCLRDTLSYTHLTALNLQGCSTLTTRSLHHLLVRSRGLQVICLKGLTAVTNTTCELLATFCTQLERLNLCRCPNMDAEGIRSLSDTTLARGERLRLKLLKVSGLKYMDDATMRLLGKAAPHLEVLDLSYVRQLHNSALEAFVTVDDTFDYERSGIKLIRLNARQVGRESSNDVPQFYTRRVTRLRHLSLSYCILLTDMACSNIAYAVPHLEFLEMAGIGADLKDDGLVRLLDTTPHIRRVDLEDATDITDSVLSCITPVTEVSTSPSPAANLNPKQERPPQPGHALEWLTVSHAGNLSDEAFLALVRACPKLRVLEADNTRLSGNTLKEFVNRNRNRKALNAKFVAIDCRNVDEGVVKELGASGATRPRLGMRVFWARRLSYVDGEDEMCEDDLKVGQDECDPEKVVVKTFYSWQTVDAVRSAREKRRKATSRRVGNSSSDFPGDVFDHEFGNGGGRSGGGLTRWWSPNSRPGSGRNSPPIVPDLANDGCIVM